MQPGYPVPPGQPPQPPPDRLSPEQMQRFTASLIGLPPEEIRKAKVLYIRNAIAEYRAQAAGFRTFRQAQGCFALLPFFRPFLGIQKSWMDAQLQLSRERIRNAIEVWKEDLQGEQFELTNI
jgi:hypothetical protein